mgnify:FL=1
MVCFLSGSILCGISALEDSNDLFEDSFGGGGVPVDSRDFLEAFEDQSSASTFSLEGSASSSRGSGQWVVNWDEGFGGDEPPDVNPDSLKRLSQQSQGSQERRKGSHWDEMFSNAPAGSRFSGDAGDLLTIPGPESSPSKRPSKLQGSVEGSSRSSSASSSQRFSNKSLPFHSPLSDIRTLAPTEQLKPAKKG